MVKHSGIDPNGLYSIRAMNKKTKAVFENRYCSIQAAAAAYQRMRRTKSIEIVSTNFTAEDVF